MYSITPERQGVLFRQYQRRHESYNLCVKSWDTRIISAAYLVVSPLPLKTMLLYTVLTGTEKVAMPADPSLTNKHLIQHCF